MSHEPHRKPAELLRQMAARHGERITQRDTAALLLAATTLENQADQLQRQSLAMRDTMFEAIGHGARADALQEGLRALLETHA